MSTESDGYEGAADEPTAAGDDDEALAARAAYLAEENRRLREEYRRARKQEYHRTGLGFAGLGLLALVGALLFPGTRDVLFALAGTGLFVAVLIYFLTPERFIAASVGQRVYDAFADSMAGLVADLDLQETGVYVPTDADRVRLFLPQHGAYAVPEGADLERTVVVAADDRRRGVCLSPTGDGLYEEFERASAADPATDPVDLAAQIADALVEVHELVDSATTDVDREAGRLALEVTGSAYGPVDGIDHPVASFAACGLARTLDVPVEIEEETGDRDEEESLVVCSWDPEAVDVDDESGVADTETA
ncbi:hypothetical protein BV210_05845 [Halorientalis sp. IM1011]|uniref:hypothetical protein n=1 Tax=Halorientalis sp. IM1011 TaxID=1932360 RepID=UPI00097CC74F|nr:hypothetical protein [Halorientalis sp. IM1011]AQL42264.1 hypothetical protein BV210_05845 [Halorientalis sp. IM1011]